MANVKISELPVVTSVTNSDVLPVVASTTTSQLTMTNLAKSMPQVSSSISASFATTAFTATSASYALSASFEITYETSSSYADFAVSASYALSSSRAVTSSLATSSSFAVSSSFATSASWAPTTPAFPFTGSAQILGTLGVTGSVLGSSYIQGEKVLAVSFISETPFGGTEVPAFGSILRGGQSVSTQGADGYTFYFQETGIGHSVRNASGAIPMGSIHFARNYSDTVIGADPFGPGEGKVPIYTIISDNYSLTGIDYTYGTQNGRNHVLTVSGSILSKNAVSLGSNLTDNHIVSGSINVVGGQVAVSGSLIVSGSTTEILGGLLAGTTSSPLGIYSVVLNTNNNATGNNSLAHGNGTTAAGVNSHAEGANTYALAAGSHAEGVSTVAAGSYSHAEGSSTLANGVASHAEGYATVASGSYSHAEGEGTIASGSAQHVTGKYNKRGNTTSLFVIGNGTGDLDANRSDIIRVNQTNVEISGSLIVSGSLAINTSGSFILPGTASANPVAGNFYFDFTNNKLYAYNGSNWVTASLGI